MVLSQLPVKLVQEVGNLQGMMMLVVLLLLGFVFTVVLSCVYRIVNRNCMKKDKTELDKVEKDSYYEK